MDTQKSSYVAEIAEQFRKNLVKAFAKRCLECGEYAVGKEDILFLKKHGYCRNCASIDQLGIDPRKEGDYGPEVEYEQE